MLRVELLTVRAVAGALVLALRKRVGNAFYSVAVQAGASNWKAFPYGSSDAGNSITVDNPLPSLWVMALSVRVLGLSSFSILLPEAIMGVLTVALVSAIVRRHLSPQAGLIAGVTMALTPVATLMFRFNNPDALLVLLVTLATYPTMRGIMAPGRRLVEPRPLSSTRRRVGKLVATEWQQTSAGGRDPGVVRVNEKCDSIREISTEGPFARGLSSPSHGGNAALLSKGARVSRRDAPRACFQYAQLGSPGCCRQFGPFVHASRGPLGSLRRVARRTVLAFERRGCDVSKARSCVCSVCAIC